MLLASVALSDANRSFDKLYDYEIPKESIRKATPGVRVLVPFGANNKSRPGLIIEVWEGELDFKVKKITQFVDDTPYLTNEMIKLAKWMRDRYFASWGDCIKLMIPSQKINEKTVKAVVPKISNDEFDALNNAGKIRSIHHIRVMEVLYSEGICALQDLLLIPGVSHATIRSMEKKGWVSYSKIEIDRDPIENVEGDISKDIVLTVDQAQVLSQTIPLLSENRFNEVLLHGVTGSGKTEVYIRLIEEVIKSNRSAIVLVPEISLTPQMTSRFVGRFGNRVAIQHSRLSQGERYDQWHKIKSGQIDIVIGARSAIFAPLANLGIIIIDEEHELTYKSETTPKYDARHVARARCNINSCLLVLGSATPSVESYYRAKSGKIKLLEMNNRPNTMPMPNTILVDLRQELKDGNRSVLSRRLEEELIKNKHNKEQSILFLNRRGYASFVLCRDCGYVIRCPQCSVSLTIHSKDKKMICHYCGYAEEIAKICPSCKSANIKDFGTGTQRVEELLTNHQAAFKVLRMDMDTTSGKNGHQKILNAFRNKEADILTGTQMVAKGHDFPEVTLVGVLSADAMLFSSDFRANERTFQLITQAVGRAGRGEKPGRAVIQAYNIEDYSIQTALVQDYKSFYQKEIEMRRLMVAPPFCHIGVIIVSEENEEIAKKAIIDLRNHILSCFGKEFVFECSEVLAAPIFIVKNRARWRIIIKMQSINGLVKIMNDLLDYYPKLKAAKTSLSVDIDPANMM